MSSPLLSANAQPASPCKSLLPALKAVELQPKRRSESASIAPPLLRIERLNVTRVPTHDANEKDPAYMISIFFQQPNGNITPTTTAIKLQPKSPGLAPPSPSRFKTVDDHRPADLRVVRKASEFGSLRDKIHLCAKAGPRDFVANTPCTFCEPLTEFLSYGAARSTVFARSIKSPTMDASALFSCFLRRVLDDCQASLQSDQRPSCRGERHIPCLVYTQVWASLTSIWGTPELSDAQRLTAILGREAPTTTIDWYSALNDGTGSIVGDRIHHWLAHVWSLLVTCGLRRLWQSQVRRAYAPTETDVDDVFATRAAWARSLRATITAASSSATATSELDRRILCAMYRRLAIHTLEIPRYSGTVARYVLLFDGGSRGNPGPGGSGSVIVRLDPEPHIIWAAAMAYASRHTTNNFAEYKGLCTGLLAADRNAWHPLAVVGDSMMIIRQLTHRRKPKSHSLLPWYEQARSIADGIHLIGWTHHYRQYNKMADKAANQAMDTGTSYQAFGTSSRPEIDELREWLNNDISHWVDVSLETTSTNAHDPGTNTLLLHR